MWMSVHFDHRYEGLLCHLTGWLRDTSNTDNTAVANIVLRYWVEQLFQEFATAVSKGGSQPRIATCQPFNVEGSVHGFLSALEAELLTITIPRSPFPHALVKHRMAALGFTGPRAHPSPPPPAGSHTPPPKQPAPPAAQAGKICAWHAAHVLGVEGSQGPAPACRHGDRCINPHVNPQSLQPSDILTAAEAQLRANTTLGANLRTRLNQTPS